MFPELELESKAFVLSKFCAKEGSFDTKALMSIDKKDYNTKK